MIITVISYPDNNINFSQDVGDSLLSSELVKYMWVDLSQALTDTYVEITYNGVTKTLLIEDECRYTPIDIFFQNKEGAEQVLTFFKKSTESLTITNEEYESDNGQPLSGFHQYVKYNVQAKKSFKVNSGFVKEDKNETFKELLFSRRVWSYVNSQFIPLNVSSKTLELKTKANDRLINYEIGFDFAFNEINNV
jgi:hypothetical protein